MFEKNVHHVSCKERQIYLACDGFLSEVSSVWPIQAAHSSVSKWRPAVLLVSQTVEHLYRWPPISEKVVFPHVTNATVPL